MALAKAHVPGGARKPGWGGWSAAYDDDGLEADDWMRYAGLEDYGGQQTAATVTVSLPLGIGGVSWTTLDGADNVESLSMLAKGLELCPRDVHGQMVLEVSSVGGQSGEGADGTSCLEPLTRAGARCVVQASEGTPQEKLTQRLQRLGIDVPLSWMGRCATSAAAMGTLNGLFATVGVLAGLTDNLEFRILEDNLVGQHDVQQPKGLRSCPRASAPLVMAGSLRWRWYVEDNIRVRQLPEWSFINLVPSVRDEVTAWFRQRRWCWAQVRRRWMAFSDGGRTWLEKWLRWGSCRDSPRPWVWALAPD